MIIVSLTSLSPSFFNQSFLTLSLHYKIQELHISLLNMLSGQKRDPSACTHLSQRRDISRFCSKEGQVY